MINLNDAYEIARFIKEADKQTPVKVYVSGKLLNFKKNDKFKVLTIRTLQKDGIDIEGADEKNIDIGIGFEKRVDLNVDEEYEFYCERELLNARMVINRDS